MYFSNYASSLALSHSDLYMNLLSFSPKLLVCKWKEEKKKKSDGKLSFQTTFVH